jgi:hypothetical protein
MELERKSLKSSPLICNGATHALGARFFSLSVESALLHLIVNLTEFAYTAAYGIR